MMTFAPHKNEIAENSIWRFFEKYSFIWLTPREEIEQSATPIILPVTNDRVFALPQRHPDLHRMIVPVSFRPEFSPQQLPPIDYWGVLSPLDINPKTNFDRIVTSFAADLGPHATSPAANVYSAIWSEGPAKVEITVWPRELNWSSYRPGCWIGDPATREAVHVFFHSGLVFNICDSEKNALLAAKPLETPPSTFLNPAKQASLGQLDFLRRLPIDQQKAFRPLQGKLLLNEDYQGLFFIGDEFTLVIPLASALDLQLTRVTPAKGSGYSELKLTFASSKPNRNGYISIASGDKPDDLTAFAQALAPQLKLPLDIQPYQPNS